jgi:hypothetical protein
MISGKPLVLDSLFSVHSPLNLGVRGFFKGTKTRMLLSGRGVEI